MYRFVLVAVSLMACGPKQAPPADHCGEITADEVWTFGVHNLTCIVDIRGATVTVEAGSELVVSDDAGLRVGCEADGDSTLVIAGTEEDPVTVAPAGAAGGWTYLYFCDHSVDSELHWTTIDGAGAYDNTTTRTSLVVDTQDVLVDHVDITASAGRGFTLVRGGTFSAGSTQLAWRPRRPGPRSMSRGSSATT